MTSQIKRRNESQAPSLIMSLPEDVIFDILARVPRFEYSTLYLVSKQFGSLVASPENLRYTLHILLGKANGKRRLVLIRSVPAMNPEARFLAVGSSIYVFGGGRKDKTRDSVLRIDCRFHTVEHLPRMPVRMAHIIADVIDGRIYVIGKDYEDWKRMKKKVMVLFNIEAQMWEPAMIITDIDLQEDWCNCVVMADKMYTQDYRKSFVYKPKEGKWETEEMLSTKVWGVMRVSSMMCWGVVKGLEELLPESSSSDWISTASYGGKLDLCFSKGI
ncbi:PREDICTED: F-box/kelch-repeat protein At4g38940-like [Brassica oleracea var. oleracea]|uniref:F-box/kelch-repeat protein At4g38940-like n=1 Tax=Brassica oleracea var. oleracea TaxID=109376 RepID=UPI0006A6A246|nr:PREDICTED: F-box/kelch-repeat protein At4g38940-like [Brassica oleracea var. oleracea]